MLRLAFVVASALMVGLATRMPEAQWLEPLEAQRLGQMPLLFARAACIAMLLVIAPALRRGRGRGPFDEQRAFVVASLVLLAASLAVNAAAAALVIVVIAASLRTRIIPTRAANGAAVALAAAFALAAGVAFAQLRPPAPPQSPAHDDVRGQALYWEQRDNPFRALHFARAWGAEEARAGPPGDAALCIARLASRLGDHADARAILADVATRGAPHARVQARALLERAP